MRTPSKSLRVRALLTVLALSMLTGGSLALAGSASAWELPEGREYEMVSPPYKGDYGVDTGVSAVAAAPDGESFIFISQGVFAGAKSNLLGQEYIARRTPGGWVTTATSPPPREGRVAFAGFYSPDLCKQLSPMFSPVGEEAVGTSALELSNLCEPEISFTQAWPLPDGPATFPGYQAGLGGLDGASGDLSHAVFKAHETFDGEPYNGGLREIVGLGGPEPKEEDVATVGQPDGPGGSILQPCGPQPGGETFPFISEVAQADHAINEDGSEIFFEHCEVSYVRVDDSTTLHLAGSFLAASADGSKAFVSQGGELFVDVIDREPGHEAIAEAVPIAPGVPASMDVASDDGSHVYFSSPGLLAGPNAQGASPQAGASNLYVWDSLTGKTAFIAVTEVDVAQSTPDGRFLVFVTHAQLTPDDSDTAADVYRYDTETGGLVRVSVGEDGYDDDGNNDAFDATIASPEYREPKAPYMWRLNTRAISEDGSTIVFSTAGPLSPRALNGNVNIYVWHEGRVGMISTGLSPTSDEDPIVSQSGRDIFFATRQSILPQDDDGLPDIYDARIGGGFPEPPVPAGGCSGDTCQGPPSVPSLLGAPASATFHGLGNPAPSSEGTVAPPAKAKPKPKCKAGYRRNKRGRCVRTKKRARRAARAPGGAQKRSTGGKR